MNLTIERYVWAVSRRLRRDAPAERRRAIRRELRGHLLAAAEDVGAEEAVARAGEPTVVAREYTEVEAGRPRRWRPRAGLVAAVIAYVLVAVLQQREIVLHQAAQWGRFDPWSANLWLLRLDGDLERGVVVHVDVQRIAYVVIPLVAFLLASRVWRLGRPRWKREAAAL
jgi:hypothetical protein